MPSSPNVAAGRRALPTLIALALLVAACGSDTQADQAEPTPTVAEPTATPVLTPTPGEPVDQATPTPIATPTPQEPTPEPTTGEPAEIEELPDEPSGNWVIVSDEEVLAYASPGGGDVVATFGPGEVGLGSTGRRALADGREWKELSAGEGRPPSWVPADTLAPDESPVEVSELRACFATGGTALVMDFSQDIETFVGGLRIDAGGQLTYEAVAGRRTEGSVFNVVVRASDGTERSETWASGAGGIVVGNDDLDSVDCGQMRTAMRDIDATVTAYPPVPGG